MPIYLGYPVTIREAYRILRIDVNYHISKYYKKNPDIIMNIFIENNIQNDIDDYLFKLLKQYITNKKKIKINIFKTQNKQCIIGYEIENDIKLVESKWVNKKHINTFEIIILLNKLENELENDLHILNADLSEVLLEEPYKGFNIDVVKNPKPYIVTI